MGCLEHVELLWFFGEKCMYSAVEESGTSESRMRADSRQARNGPDDAAEFLGVYDACLASSRSTTASKRPLSILTIQ